MQFYYDHKMPLRILDEGEFWKLQESEHTEVIRALVPNLEKPFADVLQEWEQAFARMHGNFVQYIEAVVRSGDQVGDELKQRIMELVRLSDKQSQQFILLLNQLATESEPIRTNPTVITVLNHIRRESEYFIGISEAFLSHGF
ncbi:DUF2935 domain-containing protein [Paenibacillus piri]|uniref:DUF2935 domain-containing protein n=1 Tax=Paenibacillus piri TaxID=2547395 RepID=A0A4R5KYI1_9BACL|nr:DUF2935 domain-containing protein [Paenibacillus piri]TDG00643.1 DUF2935 domain-containing protein [Paenibacillus piri]